MTIEAIVSIAAGTVALLTVLWRVLRGVHNGVNLIGDLRNDVADLHKTLNNGMRSEIRMASERAKKAQQLAGEAAQAAATADQHATEGRDEIRRSVNALRAEVDIYTNVVMTDRARIKAALRELGKDIPDDVE